MKPGRVKLGHRAYVFASSMKTVMPPAAVPFDWAGVFDLRRGAGRLVSASLVVGY